MYRCTRHGKSACKVTYKPAHLLCNHAGRWHMWTRLEHQHCCKLQHVCNVAAVACSLHLAQPANECSYVLWCIFILCLLKWTSTNNERTAEFSPSLYQPCHQALTRIHNSCCPRPHCHVSAAALQQASWRAGGTLVAAFPMPMPSPHQEGAPVCTISVSLNPGAVWRM